ncbi:hypothetical protein, partial [Slackia isoflavoniconvertens]|uniref:hypothetical protein n=1 Tax=Slackia isoflavoniconvertens TaxID=572010 RepID=UPI003AB8F4BD
AFLGTFYAWSLKIIPMADDHVFSFLDVFSFQFAKEILRYLLEQERKLLRIPPQPHASGCTDAYFVQAPRCA